MLYSNCPKSGRPDFGIFETCPVPKLSGFQTTSEIRRKCPDFGSSGSNFYMLQTGRYIEPDIRKPHITSGFQTFCTKTGSKPVWNRFWYRTSENNVISGFQTSGSNNVRFTFLFVLEPDVQNPDVYVRFSDERLKTGRLRTGHKSKAPKTGRPVFGHLLYLNFY